MSQDPTTTRIAADKQRPFFLCGLWRGFTRRIRTIIKTTVVKCALHAARYPLYYVVGLTTLSFLLVAVGFVTNFSLELDVEAILSPTGSQPALHKDWVFSQDGFPNKVREVALLLHRHGDNVLTSDAMERVFLGLDAIRTTEGYNELCQQGSYVDFEGVKTCRVLSATAYFEDHNVAHFYDQIHSDEELRAALSASEFANGSPVYHDSIMGHSRKDGEGNLTFAESFLVIVFLPDTDNADDFEAKMLPRLDKLRRGWIKADEQADHPVLQMDMVSIYATQTEYQRAIEGDLYLIPVVAIMMSSFVALTFASFGYGHVHAKTRTTLGAASVWTILMSFLSGCGVMFLCGVPFTPITQILPFVVFGIGLDDTFIIMGAYLRTDPSLDILPRIELTMDEVAHSISLTTITTVFAFLLGLRSSLPGVQWLCLYAFTAILIDFVYQITLFVAFIALDEQRIQAKRRDVCFWLPEKADEEDDDADEVEPQSALGEDKQQQPADQLLTYDPNLTDMVVYVDSPEETGAATRSEQTKSIPERIMSRYADLLLKPYMKGIVLVLFAALLGGCAYSTTLLEQEFKIGDFVPNDSYMKDVLYSLQNYASVVRPIAVYFRDIDQTNPAMRQQMVNYVNELEELKELSSISVDVAGDLPGGAAIGNSTKPFCWVRDLQQLASLMDDQPELAFVQNLTFLEQLNLALSNPTVQEVYGQDIIRDETGNITASRCWLFLTDIDLNSVQDQIDLLHDQREIGAAQPVNQGKPKGGWSFFFYDDALFYWEAYDVAVQELFFTIVSGVVALTVIAFVLIPHWSAVCFVTPTILVLYTNYLGTLQFMGLHINGIFYFCVLVSIGLLVDFLLHILMRYYETSPNNTRDERVKETLETMGSSILLGGLTTFLGVVPLCLSSTKIFMIVFKAFFAMVVLGLAHGLILLPVVLSLLGPRTGIESEHHPSSISNQGDSPPHEKDIPKTLERVVDSSSILDSTSSPSSPSTFEEGTAVPSVGVTTTVISDGVYEA